MDNDSKNNKKGSVVKSLAVAGFVAIIIIISWLSVQLVNVLPSAFSSLASLAEGLNQQSSFTDKDEQENLIVTSNTTIINTGETIDISWSTTPTKGNYIFSYTCTSGVNISLLNINNDLEDVACDTIYNIGKADSITVSAESEKKRFENITYTISFLESDKDIPTAIGTASFTVINSSIKDPSVIDTDIIDETEDQDEEDISETPEVNEPDEEPESEQQPETPVVTNPPAPTYEQELIYEIPTSNPNGRTDLSTQFLSSGNIIGKLYFAGEIEQNDTGAIQFEVKNLGSKTSEDWTYSVSLPGGSIYKSTDQKPLKPNERAVVTVGFPTDNTSRFTFVVRINEPSDQAALNDHFSKTVSFVK